MNEIPKFKILNSKLFIPYYSNSKNLYNKNKHRYSFIKTDKSNNYKLTAIPNNTKIKNIKIEKTKLINYITPNKTLNAYDKADIESNIVSQIKLKNYQKILAKDKEIKYYLTSENNEIKREKKEKKFKIIKDLEKIIDESLLLVKNINKCKNLSHDNKKLKKNLSQGNFKIRNVEFLLSLGINIDLINNQNKIINKDKAWEYITKISKGKNIIDDIDDILRYKIVTNILNLRGENRKKILNINTIKKNAENDNKRKIKKLHVGKINELKNKNINKSLTPFNNNRLKMIEIINRSNNNTTLGNEKNKPQ